MTVLCEAAPKESGIAPELSHGSHFFHDLVEAGIFYTALMPGEPDVIWHPERVLAQPSMLIELVPDAAPLEGHGRTGWRFLRTSGRSGWCAGRIL